MGDGGKRQPRKKKCRSRKEVYFCPRVVVVMGRQGDRWELACAVALDAESECISYEMSLYRLQWGGCLFSSIDLGVLEG